MGLLFSDNKLYEKNYFTCLANHCLYSVWAQTTGKVTDKNDGLGVPYANIYLKDIKMNVSCDAEGNFTCRRIRERR